MSVIPIRLTNAGARWFHTSDHGGGVNLTRARLGDFFFECLTRGVHIENIWAMAKSQRAFVQVSVYMTDEMREAFERETKFRFQEPPKLRLNENTATY